MHPAPSMVLKPRLFKELKNGEVKVFEVDQCRIKVYHDNVIINLIVTLVIFLGGLTIVEKYG